MALSTNLKERLDEIKSMRELAEYCSSQTDGLQQYYEAHTFAGYEGINPDKFTYLIEKQKNIYRTALNLMAELDCAGALIRYPKKPSRIPVEIAIRDFQTLLSQNGVFGYPQSETERCFKEYTVNHAMRDELGDKKYVILQQKVPPIVQSIVNVFIKLEAEFKATL